MRVLIFEPQFVGHNLAYVDYLATRLIALGCEVHLATSEQARDSEEFEKHLGHFGSELQYHAISGFHRRPNARGISVNGLRGARSLLLGLHEGLTRSRPEHLYVPMGNSLTHWMGSPNPVSRFLKRNHIESEVILLFGKYAYPHRGLLAYWKEKLAIAAIANGPWTRIHHILPHAVRRLSSFSRSMCERTRLLPDPVDSAPEMNSIQAREILQIPTNGRYISLIGLIERRKGVFELLEAFRGAIPALQADDRILLAGKATDEVRGALGSRFHDLVNSGRVIVLDRHLSRNELWAACFGSNVVSTPYPSHMYSASIVIRAAAAKRFVLANSIGWMDEAINRFSLGLTCNTNDISEFSNAITRTLQQSQNYTLSSSAEAFVRFHSEANFSSLLTDRICTRLGGDFDSSEVLRWEEVIHCEVQEKKHAA